jgi:hypothetical protein
MNKANRDFAEEIRVLLCDILDALNYSYDTSLNLKPFLEGYTTRRMCTEFATERRLQNLEKRGLFLIERRAEGIFLKLNPKYADTEIDLLIGSVRLPKKP